MPSTFRSPRSLPAWLELDYFRRRGLFRGWWGGSLVVAFVVAMASFGVLLGASGRKTFQAGPLSAPHAMFQDRCELCHQDNGATLTRLWRGNEVSSVPDEKCQSCHAGSHHNSPHAEMGTCVSCHREHRGHAALVRVPDSQCIACHENLRREDGSSSPFGEHAVSFDAKGGHPPFRRSFGKEKDPGTLKFNHATHLAEKGVLVRHSPQEYEKLECAICHQEDAAGRYMKPISYDIHCKRCHPLAVQLTEAKTDLEFTHKAHASIRRPVRHPGKTEAPGEVRASLRDRLTELIQGKLGPTLLDPRRQRPVPRFPYPVESAPLAERQFAWVSNQLVESERILFDGEAGCVYCHTVEKPARSRPDRLPLLNPSNIRDRWWDHAKFKHDTHRMLNCEECHDKAKKSKETADILLPGIDLCAKCHDAKASQPTARSDCVECHGYHDPKSQKEAREKGTLTLENVLGK